MRKLERVQIWRPKGDGMLCQRVSCLQDHLGGCSWEVLIRRREPTNSADSYAVAVLKEETIIGHLPWKMSKVCSLFLRRGGSIRCKVTGSRRYSSDLPQGGLEIPCSLLFKANVKEITKLRKVLAAKCTILD